MAPTKARIDLFTGWPAPSLLPINQLKDAAAAALSDPCISSPGLGYGPDEGYGPLKENIARLLTDFYGPPEPVSSERICITGGASQNMACILQVFTDPAVTKYVWMVEPAYYLARRIFEDAGFGAGRIRGVPGGDDAELGGIDIEFLEAALEDSQEQCPVVSQTPTKPSYAYRKFYKHVIYCVPTFSNPSGITMPLEKRRALVQLARKFDALVVCDDVYDFLHWEVPGSEPNQECYSPLPRLVDLDRHFDGGPTEMFGNVVSNGSFSKIVGPGCRVGWAEGTGKFIYGLSKAGSTRSGGAPSQLVSTFSNGLLADGSLAGVIRKELVPACARRYLALSSAARTHLVPLGASFDEVSGGYFVWLKLPEPLAAEEVVGKALEEEDLVIGPGGLFAVSEGSGIAKRVRLCFMWEDETKLAEGVERLARVMQRLL
ncbi:putative aminotransferase [Neofusicoccum parvum]|uniref:Aminotransferase n=1 Tax=Neofusicoccum parvum TaxID=310453 RepID=A0ACB5RWG5_9PEZI|nr:putative aminotransferase [Neofusicoccum parvum]